MSRLSSLSFFYVALSLKAPSSLCSDVYLTYILLISLPISIRFVAILFVDALQRMVKVMSEGETAKDQRGIQDVRAETNYAARKFYSQRNMYLTGFTLFLSL